MPAAEQCAMIDITMRKFLWMGALCATTFGFVCSAVCAQETPLVPMQGADKSGAELLLAARAAVVTPYNYDPALKELAPAEILARQRKLVAQNALALVLARQALRVGIEISLPQSQEEDFGELMAPARELARQFTFEAAERAANGDGVAAAQSSLDALELGAQTGRGPHISALSGLAIAQIARRSLQEHAALLSAAQSREVAGLWEKQAARTVEFSQILRIEADFSTALMRSRKEWVEFDDPLQRILGLFAMKQALADGELAPAEADEMLEFLAFSLDDLVADLRVGFDKAIVRAQTPYFAAARAEPIQGANPNTGFIVENVASPRTRFSFERDIVSNRLLVAALRLRAIKLESGQYPATFAAGADPFAPDLAPLIYKRAGNSYALYSVGPDGVDDNGAPIQTVITDRETGAKSVSDRLMFDSTGDIVAPVL